MIDLRDAFADRPLQLAWLREHLDAREQVLAVETLHGGITCEMRRLTVGPRCGASRQLVLRTYVTAKVDGRVVRSLDREAMALTFLAGTDVPAPALIGVDREGEHCEYPALLMTHLPGRTALAQKGIGARIPLLARQLAEIHALRPSRLPPAYDALTTPDTVVVPAVGDKEAWAGAIDVIRGPAPNYEAAFLHRDFQPGNVLFDAPASDADAARVAGVVDWASASSGPTDLDVAHCATNLALLHGHRWGLGFPDAYLRAGGRLAAAAGERRYWLVRDALAASEEVRLISQPWREAGRTDLTPQVVEERLDAYVTSLMTESNPA